MHETFSKNFELSRRVQKTQEARIQQSGFGSGSKLNIILTYVGTRNWAPIWPSRLVYCFTLVQTCGTPMYQ